MITGFNTDIEHDGTVYHVQTEDKGLETPLILSLVYVGGAILASKRAAYDDLLGANFDQTVLGERLQRQHKLICAAVNAGRIEDLKRMSQREAAQTTDTDKASQSKKETVKEETTSTQTHDSTTTHDLTKQRGATTAKKRANTPPTATQPPTQAQTQTPIQAQVQTPTQPPIQAPTRAAAVEPEFILNANQFDASVFATPEVLDAERQENEEAARSRTTHIDSDLVVAAADVAHALHERIEDQAMEPVHVEIDDALHVEILDEKDYYAGEMVTLRVAVLRGQFGFREVVRNASVTVKVLGTEFRPLILTSKTDDDGLAVVHVWLPRFKHGRAAILVRAHSDDCSAELRRIIHHN